MFQFRQFTIEQQHCAMKVGTDGVLLGAWACGGSCMLDVGTGTGIIALMLAQRYPDARVTAIDMDEGAVRQATENVVRSPFSRQVTVLHETLQQHQGLYDAIVCNPPYMPVKRGMANPKDTLAVSKHEITCTLEDVARFAKITLKDRGRFFMIHRADRVADVTFSLRSAGLEPKRILPVHPYQGKPANLILVEAMKKGQPQCRIDSPLFVYDKSGQYTDAINAIYDDAPK